MKIVLLFLFLILSNSGVAQDKLSGLWLPLKRLEQVDKLKKDACDSANTYPFMKIKFFSNKKISLFGFDAADPDVCTIIPQKEKGLWVVKDSIFNTLYPEFVIGSKVTLQIKNDTLYLSLRKNKEIFFQKFVRKYDNVNLTDYSETEVGNILLKGTYLNNDGIDSVQIGGNGIIESNSKNGLGKWNYVFYRFKNYAPGSCRGFYPMSRGIVRLTNNKGSKEDFFIKFTDRGVDFYKILKIDNWWTEAKTEFAFSLFFIR